MSKTRRRRINQKLPFPEDMAGKPHRTGEIPVDRYGNLGLDGSDEISVGEGRLRQYCNRWGWKQDRPAMLLDLRRVVAEIVYGVDTPDDD